MCQHIYDLNTSVWKCVFSKYVCTFVCVWGGGVCVCVCVWMDRTRKGYCHSGKPEIWKTTVTEYIHNLGLSIKTMIIHGVPTGTISCTLPGKKGDGQIWQIPLESQYRAFQPCRDMSKPSRTALS